MKTHSAIEPGRPGGPAPERRFLPRAAWVLLCLAAALFTADGVRAQSFTPVIDNIIALEDNDVYFDHDGDTPATILVKNIGSVTGTLSNFSLTDDPAVPRKWIIPTGVGGAPLTIAAGETIVFFASAKNRTTPPYATNFLLPCRSTGYLYNPQGAQPAVSQKTVYSRDCPECTSLFNVDTISAWLVPTATNPPSTGGDWRLPSFTLDTSWPRGQRCVGYDSGDPLLNNMILYATFDAVDVNTSTRVITDVSGPTVHNGTWPASAAAPHINIPATTPVVVNQSVGFTGPTNTNSFTSYAHHAELNPGTGSYTFSVWVRPTSTAPQASEVLFRKGGTSTTDPGYLLTRQQLAGARFRIQTSTAAIDVGFTNALAANAWTHIMVVIERTPTLHQARIYRDGTQMNFVNFAAATSIGAANAALVQAQGSGAALAMFQGFQDEFITWGRALTNAEVTQVFNAGAAGKRVDDPTAPGSQAAIYGPLIQTNVQAAMKGVNTSLYERIRFNIPNPALVSGMTFKANYDDGFIAYINGVEIARRNAPTGVPAWNSAATIDRKDTDALVQEEIPVPTTAISTLVATGNVLAIHALNFTANDQRFLICPDLCYSETRPQDCFVTTNGRDFWITFPGNAPEDLPGNPLRLSVCITGSSGTTGNVSIPGLSFSQNFVLPVGGKIEISLPKAASLDKSNTIENKGVHITASQNVAVYGKTRIDFSTDTFLAHQSKVLGSNYLVLGWQNSWTYPDLNGSQFGIVATTDNTHVTVIPKVTTGSHTAGVPYNFILNQGQTYLLRNTSNTPADLTGSEITSDNPVAVFGGHRCANVSGTQFFCNTVLEQNLPVALWNTEYCTAPLVSRSGGDTVRVLASENATTISINGVAQPGVLNKGDKRDYLVTTGAAFTSTRKFLAAHISRSSDADDVDNADPFQLNAQPTASWLAGYKFCTGPAAEFPANYCHVIARTAEIAGVSISPAPLASGGAVVIPGSPYSYRRFTLAAGTTYVSSGRTHGLEIYGWDQFDAYGHSGGMGFNDTLGPTFTQCPPDITIFTTPGPNGDFATLPDLGKQFGVTDNCCPEQSIVVNQTPGPGTLLQEGDYTVVLSATDCTGNRTTCIVIVHVRKDPRAAAFPTAFGNPALEATVWGWTANPDFDFLTNEQEYMLGTNMAVPSAMGDAFTFRRVLRNGEVVLELSYRMRNDDPSLEYDLEGGNNLMGWFGGLGHFEDISQVPDALAGFTRVTAWSVDSGQYDRFFVRLRLRRN